MSIDPSLITFAELDKQKGTPYPVTPAGEEYSLPSWYRSVRDVPLNKLQVEDISRACRQNIHLVHVIPLALNMLEANPLAGEMYDGELLVSLKAVPTDYWDAHVNDKLACRAIIEKVVNTLSEDIAADANELLSYLN